MSETLAHPTQAVRKVSEEEAYEIGIEAYHYLYPLVLMDVTRRFSTNHPPGAARPGFGPHGMFHHMRKFPTTGFNEVVRTNFDTLCSLTWLELRDPYVISVPDTQGRYCVLPIYDMWTDVIAALGTRTLGSGSAHFAIVPRCWRGTLPGGMERIEAPTTHVWAIAQIQTYGPKDYGAVHNIQDGYVVTPLSQWGRSVEPRAEKIDPAADVHTAPKDQVAAMSPTTFFNYAADLMTIDVPHLTDWSILARMHRIGLEPGRPFRLKKAPAAVQAGLAVVPEEGRRQMIEKLPTLVRVANGWQMNTDSIGAFGNCYLKRATAAMDGLAALPSEDAIYPVNVSTAEGAPVIGENRYVMRFRKDELPPTRAFWSITMHDREGFPVRHPFNRLTIGDRDALTYDPDGSLAIYIQNERPSENKVSNWLPSPVGPVGITMSLYSPRPEALDGRWVPPSLQRVND
jgi:hypothetical protein